jgi:hypothetical protein
MEALPCSAIVYRAISRKNWIDKAAKCVTPAAFVRRPAPRDEKGLSVDVESPNSCHKSLRDCFGVVSLHVGRVRDLQLDVVPDQLPHANITGLPRQEDDRTEAEHLASELAKQSRIVPPEQYMDLT